MKPSRLHGAVQAKQKDKQTISQLEKRLKAEQEARAAAEKQLAEERKRKKMEEATAARAVALAAATRWRRHAHTDSDSTNCSGVKTSAGLPSHRVESTDSLRGRIRELESECKKLSMDVKLKEEQIRDLEGKCQVSRSRFPNSFPL